MGWNSEKIQINTIRYSSKHAWVASLVFCSQILYFLKWSSSRREWKQKPRTQGGGGELRRKNKTSVDRPHRSTRRWCSSKSQPWYTVQYCPLLHIPRYHSYLSTGRILTIPFSLNYGTISNIQTFRGFSLFFSGLNATNPLAFNPLKKRENPRNVWILEI